MIRTIIALLIIIILFAVGLYMINGVSDPPPQTCEEIGGNCIESISCDNVTGELVIQAPNSCNLGICCVVER